jgi:lipopolysaccharide heptosyltransferase II
MIDFDGLSVKVYQGSLQFDTQAAAPQPKLSYKDLDLRRVLVLRLDNVGDVVLMGPALRSLRQAVPNAHITLMASPAGSQVAPLLPWVDDVIVSEALWQESDGKVRFNPEREHGLIDQMSAGAFTTALIFTRFSQSPLPAAYACYLAGIPHRLAFSQEFAGGVLSYSPRCPSEELHQAERNLALLDSIDMPVQNTQLELHVPQNARKAVDQLLGSLKIKPGMPFIVLAPGAYAQARRYAPERFAAVVKLISMETGIPILIVGSEQEAETIRPVTDLTASLPGRNIHSLIGRTTVPELAALIQRSSLVITNNSAAMHIADAFRRPIVALYSGTDMVAQWMPRSSRARLLCRPVFCSPCQNLQCPFMMECLDIRPDEVAIAALEMLAERIFFQAPARKSGVQI